MPFESESDDLMARLARDERAIGARFKFHAQLESLEQQLTAAVEEIATAINPLTEALLANDHEALDRMITTRQVVAESCLELEAHCYLLLTRQSPVSGDLRRVVATLRCIYDVERMGALLEHIAEARNHLDVSAVSPQLLSIIAELGQVVAVVVSAAVDALRSRDALASVEAQTIDDRADVLHAKLMAAMYEGNCSVREATTLTLVGRYYERIADHGVSVTRAVSYMITGDGTPH